MSDFPQDDSYTVQNGPLGVSKQGRTCMGWEKELLGFPTGLAREHHARRMMEELMSRYLRT